MPGRCCFEAAIDERAPGDTHNTGMHYWHAAKRNQLCSAVLYYCSRRTFVSCKSRRGCDLRPAATFSLPFIVTRSSESAYPYSTFCVQHLYAHRLRGLFESNRRCFGLAALSHKATLAVDVLPKPTSLKYVSALSRAWRAWQQKNIWISGVTKPPLFRRECHWMQVTLMTLADNKGQFLKKTLALLLGEAACAHSAVNVPEHQGPVGASPRQATKPRVKSLALFAMTAEYIMLVLRLCYLVALFTPTIFLAAFAENPEGRVRRTWLNLLLRTLELAGPAFIKWGQWAATRPDIFPADVCEALSKLHMQSPAHSFSHTRRVIQKAFRKPVEDIFEEFSEKPIASGSIAQVHRAVLRLKDNKPIVVAVKVRHPHVSKVIQRDFVIMNWFAGVSAILPGLKHLQLDKSVQQFATFMTKQVDLTLEAAHLMRFIYNFRKWKSVSFPAPIYPLVHPAVLVETFEEGESIVKYIDSGDESPIHTYLAYLGTRILLKMLLEDNFVHGDLHPGNIFVRFKGKRPQVVLLDVGMTAELSQRNRLIVLELFQAAACRDGRRVAQCTLQFSENQSCPDPEAFTRDVEAKFKQYLAERGTALNTGECMRDLFDQVRKHRVNLDGDVCTVMVTTLILEGWQRKLDPVLDILTMLGDMLFKAEWLSSLEYTLYAVAAP